VRRPGLTHATRAHPRLLSLLATLGTRTRLRRVGLRGRNSTCPREVVIDLPEEKRGGRRFKEYRTSERLVYRREFVVRVVKRAVYEDPVTGTVAAPLPPVPSCLSMDSDRCHPKLNIDNNPCENVIRPLCVGRKNWLFVGNEDGGASMAVLASFAATCKDNGVDFEEWLGDIVYRLDDTPEAKMDCLLPHLWKQARLQATTDAAQPQATI